jgi:tryptophan synthase alpha chain
MNRIKKTFNRLKRNKKKAFIAYITAGYPTLSATERIVLELEKSGVDIIEMGVPFSDPMADGLTIQKSSERSLKAGTTLERILKTVKNIRKKSEIPIILMSYLNPVYRYGMEAFVKDAVKCGVDGAIFPDLPPEEADEFERPTRGKEFYIIFLASPTSTSERIKLIARHSKGFIYYVSLTGVTGARDYLSPHIPRNIRKIKRITDKPVCVGFGVSNEEQARAISHIADGVIVGSAIVKVISKNIGKKTLKKEVGKFAARLARAIHEK